jgi:hypothetical protein
MPVMNVVSYQSGLFLYGYKSFIVVLMTEAVFTFETSVY